MQPEKKTPQLFLVGNPDELGFKRDGRRNTTDDYGLDWFWAATSVAWMAFTHESKPTSLNVSWLKGAAYQTYDADDPEFNRLISEARDDDAKADELLKKYPPITQYAIPSKDNEEARRLLKNAYDRFQYDMNKSQEKRQKILDILDGG